MALAVRGFNPVWSMVDLDGLQLDDTYYWFALENTIPYVPAPVYQDPDQNILWGTPIQFLANGTLPVDRFFDPDRVYRLEVRKGNTSSDPLISLVENYVPVGDGDGPLDSVALTTDNQITNPQFSLVSFSTPHKQTGITDPPPIEVAPGWFLDLTGTGDVEVQQVPLNDALENSTNSPYALRITLVGGWTGVPTLRQRLNQNGMLWAGKHVSSAVTAKAQTSSIEISARLDDSNGTPLAVVLATTAISDDFEEYTGTGELPATTNPDLPPDAYIEYKLLLPVNCDVFLSSFQLVASDLPVRYSYAQDTIERQVDHTFHYYRDSILFQPKQNILTGFNFGLNPWQFTDTTETTFNSFGYTADQVIVIQQAFVEDVLKVNNIKIGQAPVADNHGFKVTAVTAENQFALVEYIAPQTMRPYWQNKVSLMVKLKAQKQTPTSNIRVKARLLYRSSLPPVLAQGEPISSWAAESDPSFTGGWTEIIPPNDRTYNLTAGNNTLTFDGMQLPASDNDDMTLAVVLYTIDPMLEGGTPDNIVFFEASLVPNDFAMEASVLTFDEMLARCQFYYETSFELGTTVPTATTAGIHSAIMPVGWTPAVFNLPASPFVINWKNDKCIVPSVALFSGTSTTNNRVQRFIRAGASVSAPGQSNVGIFWGTPLINKKRALYPVGTVSNQTTLASAFTAATGYIEFHYRASSRLGV